MDVAFSSSELSTVQRLAVWRRKLYPCIYLHRLLGCVVAPPLKGGLDVLRTVPHDVLNYGLESRCVGDACLGKMALHY
jgi:hypothetical protein